MSMRGLYLLVFLFFVQLNAQAQLTYETLRVEYDSAWTFRNLKLIPVRFKSPGADNLKINNKAPQFISLTEALQKGKLKVKEMQNKEGADVNTLELTNASKQNILVNSGEMLSGGKQDRMIGETTIIPPGKSKSYVNVYCIEKGRWDDKPKAFKHRGRAGIELQKVMDETGRQAEVWKEIQRQYSAEKKTSETWPYLKLHSDSLKADTSYINYFTSQYRKSDSTFAGFIAVTGKQIISCEIFSFTDLTQLSFNSMLRGWIHFGVNNGAKPTLANENVKTFLDKFLVNETLQKEYVPKHGKIDRFENKVIHLIVYGD